MKIPGSGNLTKPAELQRTYQNETRRPQEAAKEEGLARRFDSVTISGERQSDAELALRGKLTQEVRTAVSSSAIAALKEQIRGGTYQPDPAAIARKMLLLGEAG